jgi:ethanolamine utilization cobalamin adenosyltransferase
MDHLEVDDAAQVLGIPVELLDTILKEKGTLWKYSEKRFLRELTKRALVQDKKGEVFVREEVEKMKAESEQEKKDWERRQRESSSSSSNATGLALTAAWSF